MIVPKRALLSVSDKTGITKLARGLADRGVELISTGGTAKVLRQNGIEVVDVSAYTGFPEIMDGRVKTLHPKVHGGILARRDLPEHVAQMERLGIGPIDLVAVNLYPFESTLRSGADLDACFEQIDIGGPTLIRSAAKNHQHVLVLTSANQYDEVLKSLNEHGGVEEETARRFAAEAFLHTARYDVIIGNFFLGLLGVDTPPTMNLTYSLRQTTRYGENPHQKGAFYTVPWPDPVSLASARVLHGKELSYNNLLDLDAALASVREFPEGPACVVVKHTNPTGIAVADTLAEAYEAALASDPVSAFGGIVAFNRPVDEAAALALGDLFLECVIAPGYDDPAYKVLARRKNLRILAVGRGDGSDLVPPPEEWRLAAVASGVLVQSGPRPVMDPSSWRVVTKDAPSEDELEALSFGFRAVAHVKSNAIVLCRGRSTVGVGAGQMSRIDAARIAIEKAGARARGSVLASDAFFPFRDVVDLAAKAGVKAIVQPGGSVRDQESIAAANELGIPMVFTGVRVFRH